MSARTPVSVVFAPVRTHWTVGLGVTVLIGPSLVALLLFFASPAHAMPARYTFKELVKRSDLIVVGRVDSIRGLPVLGKRWARLSVREVWKGPKIDHVDFLASRRPPSWQDRLTGCYDPDISDAKKAETVLLLLTKKEGVGWIIMSQGRGRFPLRSWNGNEYTTFFISTGMPKVEIPDGKSGSISAVELTTLRVCVKRILANPN